MATAIAQRPIAFPFLGETLLIPHLYPIVEALARLDSAQPIDLWVATATHEALLGCWSAEFANVRLRRAPGFDARAGDGEGRNPPLRAKLLTLLRLAPRLRGARLVLCAEQTSLWLPRLFGRLSPRFVKTSHGVGSMSARGNRRRRAAWRTFVPSELERQALIAHGLPNERVLVSGYVKSDFRQRTPARALFPNDKPILFYTPHWQRARSSWWIWGREIVGMLAAQDKWNVILAPHQRLAETAPEVRDVLAGVAHLPHLHCDLDSFAMVDGSYTAAADLYLGDTSSQVIEYLARPRPCVFLNAQRIDWRATDDHAFWECGTVVDRLDRLADALDRAPGDHLRYRTAQRTLAEASLGTPAAGAAERIARQVIEWL